MLGSKSFTKKLHERPNIATKIRKIVSLAPSLSFFPFLVLSYSLFNPLSLSHTHNLSLSLAHSRSLNMTFSRQGKCTHACTRAHTHTISQTHTHTQAMVKLTAMFSKDNSTVEAAAVEHATASLSNFALKHPRSRAAVVQCSGMPALVFWIFLCDENFDSCVLDLCNVTCCSVLLCVGVSHKKVVVFHNVWATQYDSCVFHLISVIRLRRVSVLCSTPQCDAVCHIVCVTIPDSCWILRCNVTFCSLFLCVAACSCVMQCVIVRVPYIFLDCYIFAASLVAVCFRVSQCVAAYRSVVQCVAVCV